MYAVGTEHPLKKPCLEIICKISKGDITAVTDTEVFQEVAYRYSRLPRQFSAKVR